MSVCARCKRAPPAHADTWCLACSAWEALGTELGFAWHHPGLRVVASDVLVSAARTVRALRVTRGATPSAGHARALPGEASAAAAERPPLARSLKKEEPESEAAARGSGVQEPQEEESCEVESEEEESEASEATIVPPGTGEKGLASKASAPRPVERKDRSLEAGEPAGAAKAKAKADVKTKATPKNPGSGKGRPGIAAVGIAVMNQAIQDTMQSNRELYEKKSESIQKAIEEAEAQGKAANQAVLEREEEMKLLQEQYAEKEKEAKLLLKRPTSSRAACRRRRQGSQQIWHQAWIHDWRRGRRRVAIVLSNIELQAPKVALNLGATTRPTTLRLDCYEIARAKGTGRLQAWDDEDDEGKFDEAPQPRGMGPQAKENIVTAKGQRGSPTSKDAPRHVADAETSHMQKMMAEQEEEDDLGPKTPKQRCVVKTAPPPEKKGKTKEEHMAWFKSSTEEHMERFREPEAKQEESSEAPRQMLRLKSRSRSPGKSRTASVTAASEKGREKGKQKQKKVQLTRAVNLATQDAAREAKKGKGKPDPTPTSEPSEGEEDPLALKSLELATLDSGAATSCIPVELAAALGVYKPVQPEGVNSKIYKTASGETAQNWRLGSYELTSQQLAAGSGSFARVYPARHCRFGCLALAKVFTQQEHFLDEMRVHNELSKVTATPGLVNSQTTRFH
eukprot:g8159.t1